MGDSHEAEFDCREALHRIYHFLDGELTCSPCFQMYGFETELRRVVHDKCRDAVPETLRQRIADAIDHEHAGEDDAATAAAGAHEVEDREGV